MSLRNLSLFGAIACMALFAILMVVYPGNENRWLAGSVGGLGLLLLVATLLTTLKPRSRS